MTFIKKNSVFIMSIICLILIVSIAGTYSKFSLSKEISGQITTVAPPKAYMKTLETSNYFKESTYRTNIKTVQFVDYISIPSDSLATYDLSDTSSGTARGTIMAWIDSEYNLYIGAEQKIYSKDLSNAFNSMSGVTSISFDNLDTSEAKSMSYMFSGCSSLTSLDVSNFDTSSVTNMAYMFRSCSLLTSLDLSSFDKSSVTNMSYMFYGCSGLTSLDVSKFDTSSATNMSSMFSGCSGLTSLDVSNFNTSSATNMSSMFNSCSSLTSLDLSNFDTSSATNMSAMFYGCSGLTSLDVSNFDTSSVTSMSSMFSGCTNLVTIYVSDLWNVDAVTSSYYMFTGSTKLTGGNGTGYSSSYTDKTYAVIDTADTPGYLTYKAYIAS